MKRADDTMGVQATLADESPEYRAFVEKFRPKKTTDDCYTPPEVYGCVLDWVVERYGIDREKVLRPFVPGGDYERAEYPDGCTVVDNPPFSLLSRIIDFYCGRGTPFFLFAPALTCLSSRKRLMEVNHILCNADVTYANGAVVRTGFVTNLDTDGTVLEACPELGDRLRAVDRELGRAASKKLPKYDYPDNVITSAKAQWLAAHHTPYRLNRRDCAPISKLDAMGSKAIFGGGLLLGTRAAAERAAAERAAAERAAAERAGAERAGARKWELSGRELRLVAMIDEKAGREVD